MSNFSTEIIKSLYLDEEKFKEMMREEVEKAVNAMLETEISIFLGYEKYESSGWNSGDSRNGGYKRTVHSQFGDLHIVIPRDRNGAFKQQTVPPYIQHDNALEQTVIQLYKHGVTTGEIASLIEKMYGHYYSKTTVSAITQAVEGQVEAFHLRTVENRYAVILCDATYLHLRRDSVASEALHVIYGITPDGRKAVLDYAVYPEESAANYREMLVKLKERGLEQVLLFVSDGLTGMKNALQSVYPKARYQSCWVHLSRTVARTVRKNKREEILTALKTVYNQQDEATARETLESFLNVYGDDYPKLRTAFADNDNLFTYYRFPESIRKTIYSSNLIERSNKSVKHQTKKKEQFPNEDSLDRFICCVYTQYNADVADRHHPGFMEAEQELLAMFA